MSLKYKAIVNEGFEFPLLLKDAAELNLVSNSHSDHLIINHNSLKVEVLHRDFQKREYTIKINGNRFNVHIENELDARIAEMGLSLGSESVENEIHAPMPGLILEVNVSEGQEVAEGDHLCVLEAMKMENALTAPRSGIVKSIQIIKGQTVDKGVLLIELEAE